MFTKLNEKAEDQDLMQEIMKKFTANITKIDKYAIKNTHIIQWSESDKIWNPFAIEKRTKNLSCLISLN